MVIGDLYNLRLLPALKLQPGRIFITGRGIAITQQAMLIFSPRRGDTIHRLIGTPPCQFMLISEYLGFPTPKTLKTAKISNFFAPQGRTPCLMSMKSVGFMRVNGLQKNLTFGAIS